MFSPDPTRPLQDVGIIEITEMFDADPTNPEVVKEIREELAYRRGNLPKVRKLAKQISNCRTKVSASNRERVAQQAPVAVVAPDIANAFGLQDGPHVEVL